MPAAGDDDEESIDDEAVDYLGSVIEEVREMAEENVDDVDVHIPELHAVLTAEDLQELHAADEAVPEGMLQKGTLEQQRILERSASDG